jgi:hypothetical protein
MNIPIEIMLRGNDRVFTDTLTHPVDAGQWTATDAAAVLKGMLRAINRVQNPGQGDPDISLRGLNWIVHSSQAGAVIALEIHSASVVAGPVSAASSDLEALIAAAMRSSAAEARVH